MRLPAGSEANRSRLVLLLIEKALGGDGSDDFMCHSGLADDEDPYKPCVGFVALRGGFEIAAGHRRLRAAQLAGVTEAPAIVRDMDDATFLEILTIENLQREDVHRVQEPAHDRRLRSQAHRRVDRQVRVSCR